MDGLHDSSLSDDNLLGFVLDGKALSADAQEHLAQCAACAQELTLYQKAHASLQARFYRVQCPPGTDLSLYAVDLLPQEERLRIANHILACPLCKSEVEEAQRFMQTQHAPSEVLSADFPSLIRRIFATLVPQLEMRPALRSDAQQSSWPRQYKAETLDLSLHLSSTSDGKHILLGILTDADSTEDEAASAGTLAELYATPWSAITTETQPLLRILVDDLGSMVFSPIPTGTYTLVIHLSGREMIIEDLVIE